MKYEGVSSLIDLEQARAFLRLLDPTTEEFTFQVFDDNKQRKNPALAGIRHGTLDQWASWLINASNHGCGVFVTVNETDGNGRKTENITRIRAVWHEQDWQGEIEFPLEPNIVVESSPGKFHRYWLADGMTKAEHAAVMDVMVQQYGSDKQVKDIARVMRLPGFPHQKDPAHPFMTRIVDVKGEPAYSAAEIIEAFPATVQAAPTQPARQPAPRPELPAGGGAAIAKTVKIAIEAALRTVDDPTLGRHAEVVRMAHYMRRDGIPLTKETLNAALETFEQHMRPTDTTGEVCGIDWKTETKTLRDCYRKPAEPDMVPSEEEREAVAKMANKAREAGGKTAKALMQPNPQEDGDDDEEDDIQLFDMAFPVAGLDELAACIAQGSPLVQPDAAALAALAVGGLVVSRRYVGDDGTPAHLYLGAVARSTGTLRHLHVGIQEILMGAGLRRMMRTQRMGSPGHVFRTIKRNPCTLYLCEEWGTLLQFARRQPSGQLEQTLNIIAGLHSSKMLQLDSAEEYGFRNESDDQPVIYSPALSMLALLSFDQLSNLVRPSEIGRGALESMLLVLCNDDNAIPREPVEGAFIPPHIAAKLLQIRGLDPSDKPRDGSFALDKLVGESSDLPPVQILVPMPSTVDHNARIMALSDNKALRPLLLGAIDNMCRICIVLAVWANHVSPRITPDILEWSCAFVERHMRALLERIGMFMSDDGKVSPYQKVLAYIVEAGKLGISNRHLTQRCHAYKMLGSKERRRDLISLLIEDDEIADATINGAKVLVACKFLKKKG